jgi:F-type H+-transporting ATPase subunit gamma
VSDTTGTLRRRLASAGDLRAVVRTMKSLAAMNIGQYERSVEALGDYAETVERGLAACLGGPSPASTSPAGRVMPTARPRAAGPRPVGMVVFGSDQGLVGRFNEAVAEVAIRTLRDDPAGLAAARVWAVGERVHARLEDAGITPEAGLLVPVSVSAITPLVGRILIASQAGEGHAEGAELLLVHNRSEGADAHTPVVHRLLPLDAAWRQRRIEEPWPGPQIPEVMPEAAATLGAFIREYLFVSIFRACAESLASENASRLAAMQRAERNIDELMEQMGGTLHRVRQADIDAELFDVVAGFNALGGPD